MRPDALAERYADALADLIADPADLEAAAEIVRALAPLAVPDQKARLYWLSQRAARKEKQELLGKLAAAAKAPPLVRSFLEVLLENNRMSDLGAIAEALGRVAEERLGLATARVTSASPLSDEQQEAIRRRLAHLSGKRVRLETEVDSGLIGGVRVRLDNQVIDGSVRGRLDALVARFTK
ncbi:MAG: ATP synthase F1 subunit delta [Phycisphaerae bacterium]|nr:ATP synthase F1 subunit delta [Phycisphaerae bacterium]